MSFDSFQPFRISVPRPDGRRVHDAAPDPLDTGHDAGAREPDDFEPDALSASPGGAPHSVSSAMSSVASPAASLPAPLTSADTASGMASGADGLAQAQRRADGWSPASRRVFLETLSECPNVRRAAEIAGFSHTAAYREKRVNPDFSRAWEAALVVGRDHMEQLLYDRAVHGVEEAIVYHGEITATRVRHYPRLLLALLARLDRRAESEDSRRGAVRFAQVLDAVGKGEDAAPLFDVPLPHEEDHYDPYAAHADALDGYAPPDIDGADRLEMLMAGIEDMERDWPG